MTLIKHFSIYILTKLKLVKDMGWKLVFRS